MIREMPSPGEKPEAPAATSEQRRPYERPQITWREPYQPMSFGVSCAKQGGNPGCGPGPYSS
jgi:hypothetical protein